MPVFSIGGAVFVCTDLGSCSIGNFGTKDHHLLTGLGDYDHDQYLRKNGAQAMTGNLNLNSNAVRNASEIEFSTDYAFTPLNGFLELVNKANSTFKDLRVGILDIQTAIDMNQKPLADLPTPTLDHHAATKKYVDDNIGAATTWNVVTKTTNYNAVDKECVLGNAGGGAIIITLPSPTANRMVNVKKIDASANNVTIATPGAETIDGQNSYIFNVQYQSITVVCDGSNWYII